jgi:hypothetical protein
MNTIESNEYHRGEGICSKGCDCGLCQPISQAKELPPSGMSGLERLNARFRKGKALSVEDGRKWWSNLSKWEGAVARKKELTIDIPLFMKDDDGSNELWGSYCFSFRIHAGRCHIRSGGLE